MKVGELDYDFPRAQIADKPARPRDAAKLLVLDRKDGTIQESVFRKLSDFLRPGDILIFNESRVFPARVCAHKESGGKIEVIFLSELAPGLWEVLIGGKVRLGQKIFAGKEVLGVAGEFLGKRTIKIKKSKKEFLSWLNEFGEMPLPPYMKRKPVERDKNDYQTIFARKAGSAAAPTAGLHFTNRLLMDLKKRGIQIEFITLHVGLGTFAPVKAENIERHKIHEEHFKISKKTAERVNAAKNEGRRVIACGTTVARTLESSFLKNELVPGSGPTSLYIYPGYKFRVIDGLITNFHTPKSSLLALVYAFGGVGKIRSAYDYAIKNKFRLFSYGDGMLIL